ncbi:MAG: D-aminoacylase [Acidimicrobiales bacterium]
MIAPEASVIRGALVIDGSGTDPVVADVRLGPDGVVTAMAPSITPAEGEAVIDGDGRVLAPGFVDMHSHSDLYTLVRPEDAPLGAPLGDGPKLLQGCTAQVFGQDGISAAPVGEDDVEGYAAYIAGLDGFLAPARWTWRTFAEYLAALRERSTTRVAGLVGHSTVRRLVMGMDDRAPTPVELEAMQAAIAAAMDGGALGLSTGLVYVPAAYSTTEELIALCSVVAAKGGRFFVHVRSESDRVVEATEEILTVAQRTGVHLHYSHIKAAGRANWPLGEQLIAMVDAAVADGVTVTSDVHPYTAGSTTATVLLPPWAFDGGREEALRRLGDPGARGRIREQLLTDTTSWDNWWAFSDGWEGLRIAGLPAGVRPEIVGSSFAELIRGAGIDDLHSAPAFDVAFDLLAAAGLAVSIVSFNNTEVNVARFLAQPHCTIGSDALINPDGHPHPRLYGTFPRVLGHFVRELGTIDLPSAVTAMTGRAAAALGVGGLGRIELGGRADLVLFDPASVIDRATYTEPRLPPVGIERVWVGGRGAVVGGQWTADVAAAER